MEKVKVRWASRDDAEILSKLNYEFNGVEVNPLEIEKSLTISNELVALALINDAPIGFACAQYFRSFCYQKLQGEITEMYIRDGARRLGLATLLINFMEAELSKKGATSIRVLTGATNEPALITYEKANYKRQDEIILQKTIRNKYFE